MGRKPNTLITEFFHRGEKLPDSSNRYEHTCKLCGEKFLKGRPDTLINHITKVCPAISTADRDRVAYLSGAAANRYRDKGAVRHSQPVPSSNTAAMGDQARGKRAANFQNGPSLNGLNVLAEASRRVGASNEGHIQDRILELSAAERDMVVDPALENSSKFSLEAELHAQFIHTSSPTAPFFSTSSVDATSPLPMPAVHSLLPVDAHPDNHSSQLSLIAASANEMVTDDPSSSLESAAMCHQKSDAWQLPPQTAPPQATIGLSPTIELPTADEMMIQNHIPAELSMPPASNERPGTYLRPLTTNPEVQQSNSDFFCEVVDTKKSNKKRSTFSEERRKEVRVVRKMGACLRCRMLKKTCSAGTPCSQCRNLQNPRVWMECCIRTRLMNQLESYSIGLHSTMAYHDVQSIKGEIQFEPSAGRIEVMHFELDSLSFLTFSALFGQRQAGQGIDNQLPTSSTDSILEGPSHYVHILDGEVEELSGKLDDDMLDAALELWVATAILVDPFLKWTVYMNPTLPPLANRPLTSTTNDSRIPIHSMNQLESYSLICTQLRSAVEKRAARVCRVLLGKFEQRLLQKQRVGSFRTFLATIILLNCVERMEWLFRSWECEHYIQRWPLERQPSCFASQIETFAGVVSQHLKMRSLAPAFVISPTGAIRARDVSDKDIYRWFDSIGVDYQYLHARQAAEFDANDSRSLDLKYSSMVILSAKFSNE
ncbi:hypothetical protein TMEN_9733 [Trichophyton mentagrophytes]|nr:hypothetical protein TMEN_9733 [Trichophyton mentagrophytes]